MIKITEYDEMKIPEQIKQTEGQNSNITDEKEKLETENV